MKSRVAHVVEPGRLEVVEVEVPRLEAPDMLAKVTLAGVCGTDVHMVDSPRPYPWRKAVYPMPIGHEAVAVVVEMGNEAVRHDAFGQPIGVGDRVVYSYSGCGRCYACLILLQPLLCLRAPGGRQVPVIGGAFADYVYLGESRPLFRVPDDLPDEVAVLSEPLSGALRSFERAAMPGAADRYQGFGAGKIVVIQGSGAIGLLHLIAARLAGAYRVVVVGAPRERLRLCEEFGADLVLDFTATTAQQRADAIRALTPFGIGPDLVVEGAGAPAAFKEALDLVRRGGTILEFGHFTDRGEVPINPMLIVYKDLQIIGNNGYQPNGVGTAIKVLEAYYKKDNHNAIAFDRLVTHTFPLERVADAIDISRQQHCLKATVKP